MNRCILGEINEKTYILAKSPKVHKGGGSTPPPIGGYHVACKRTSVPLGSCDFLDRNLRGVFLFNLKTGCIRRPLLWRWHRCALLSGWSFVGKLWPFRRCILTWMWRRWRGRNVWRLLAWKRPMRCPRRLTTSKRLTLWAALHATCAENGPPHGVRRVRVPAESRFIRSARHVTKPTWSVKIAPSRSSFGSRLVTSTRRSYVKLGV